MLPEWHANGNYQAGGDSDCVRTAIGPTISTEGLRNVVVATRHSQGDTPKQSIIGVLKQQLGGSKTGRSMDVLHASDVTKTDFCAREVGAV